MKSYAKTTKLSRKFKINRFSVSWDYPLKAPTRRQPQYYVNIFVTLNQEASAQQSFQVHRRKTVRLISVSVRGRVPMLLAIVLVCKSSILWHITATISWFSDISGFTHANLCIYNLYKYKVHRVLAFRKPIDIRTRAKCLKNSCIWSVDCKYVPYCIAGIYCTYFTVNVQYRMGWF